MIIQKNDHIIECMNHLAIQMTDSGYAILGNDWNCKRVCSPYSRLYLIYSGQGTIAYEKNNLLLLPQHIYLIPAGLTFDYACQGTMHQLYFHVTVQAADGIDLLTRLKDCLSCSASSRELDAALQCYKGKTLSDAFSLQQIVQHYITYFIMQSDLGTKAFESYSPFLHRLYTLVRQSIASKTTIRDLAAKLSMSESALSKRFKAETGITLGQYMDHLLFQEAQRLLLSTDDTIAQISDKLGFCDQFYFSRYFKQRQNETPSQYRKRLRVPI